MAQNNRKVLIMSRQSNTPSLDILMLEEELRRRGVEVNVRCKKLEHGISGAMKYLGELLEQRKCISKSKVVVLDSYNIAVSMFRHPRDTKVIQMWHALGAMKKFGKSILGMPEGKSPKIAKLMRMHEGYDYVFTSSEASRNAFAEAFGYKPEQLTIMSLPRVDALLDVKRNMHLKDSIQKEYPELKASKTIVYAPTLRIGKDIGNEVRDLIKEVNHDEYNLIVKVHPLTKIELNEEMPCNTVVDTKFETLETFAIADYVVTDYSAITYEAALKGLPIYFYAFDKDEYLQGRTFYLDYEKDMPGPICTTAASVVKEIESKKTNQYTEKSKEFADKYIEKKENCTAEIADFIERLL